MGITATKYIAELLQTDKERTGRIISLTYVFTFFTSLIMAIVFYFAVPWLCEVQLKSPHLITVMRLGAVLLFLSTFMGTQISVMTGFQDFYRLAVTTVIVGILSLPIYFVGAYWYGVWGAVLASIITITINIIINSLFIYRDTSKNNIRYDFLNAYKELSILKRANIPIVLNWAIFAIGNWITLLLLKAQPNGSAELGIYYVIMNYNIIVLFGSQQVFTVFFPILSELYGKGEFHQFWKVAFKNGFICTGITFFCTIPFIINPRLFMEIAGKEFANDGLILACSCICTIITTIATIPYYILISSDHFMLHFYLTIIDVIVCISVTFIFLQFHFGVYALIIGTIAQNMTYLCMVLIAYKFRKYQVVR
jgi:O-antigen/teichoic acid export membrane protein